jgi:hypothetical protein
MLIDGEVPIANAVSRSEHEGAHFQGKLMTAISALVRFSREACFDLVVTAFQAANSVGPAYFSDALFTGGSVWEPQAVAALGKDAAIHGGAQRSSRAFLSEVGFVQ